MSVQRPDYRDSKTPKSVCVYTIAQESRYLIIENLSTAGKVEDFVRHCQKFGQIEKYEFLDTHASSNDNFDVLLLKFDTISSSRYAKRKLDNKPYDYQLLRANYAPEYETMQDVRTKFQDRFISVTKRIRNNKKPKPKRPISIQEEEVVPYGPAVEQPTKKTLTGKRRRI